MSVTMKRRTFLSAAAALPFDDALVVPRTSGGQAGTDSLRRTRTPLGSLAGMTLPVLRDGYRRELFDEVLPFWERHGIDHEHGGFICALEQDGTRLDTAKLLTFQARGLWVWSFLYNQFGRQPAHLAVAQQTYRFCMTHMRRSDGTWRSRVTREGRSMDAPPADAGTLLYAAEGLQEFAAAVSDDSPRRLARELLVTALRDGTAPGVASRQGVWFLTLLAGSQYLKRGPDDVIERAVQRAVDALVRHHHNPDTGLNDEVVMPAGERSAADAGFTVFGHSVEALWMLLDHAVRVEDEALFDLLAARLRRHLDVGWDRVYGGLAHAVRVDGGAFRWPIERPLGTSIEFSMVGEYHYMKSYWSLAEVLVATVKVLARRDAPWAADYFAMAREVISERLALAPLGLPLYTLFTDRRLTRGTRTGRAENYHHPRMLMLNILALDDMIARER